MRVDVYTKYTMVMRSTEPRKTHFSKIIRSYRPHVTGYGLRQRALSQHLPVETKKPREPQSSLRMCRVSRLKLEETWPSYKGACDMRMRVLLWRR
jgi:hypothetical protein